VGDSDKAAEVPSSAKEAPSTARPARSAAEKELLLQAQLRDQARRIQELNSRAQRDARAIAELAAALNAFEKELLELRTQKERAQATLQYLQQLLESVAAMRRGLPPLQSDGGMASHA